MSKYHSDFDARLWITDFKTGRDIPRGADKQLDTYRLGMTLHDAEWKPGVVAQGSIKKED